MSKRYALPLVPYVASWTDPTTRYWVLDDELGTVHRAMSDGTLRNSHTSYIKWCTLLELDPPCTPFGDRVLVSNVSPDDAPKILKVAK